MTGKGEVCIKSLRLTLLLAAILLALSGASLFVGVLPLDSSAAGQIGPMELLFISRLPRLLAILCTGAGMSVAGLIMQQLCSNKFVSPTTGATISSAQLGILLALLFAPESTLWGRTLFAFGAAILGTWVFVWFIQRVQFKDAVMVPLVGIMFGNVIGGVTSYLAFKYEMTQALSSWMVGHFLMVLKGRYEIVWLAAPLILPAFLFANHFNIVGLGRDFSKNLGLPYNNVLGNEGRCSIIGREIGFENVGAAAESSASTHGSEASFEYLVSKDPDFIFVLDRDAAIASEGAKLAQEIMENELVMRTTAYQNGRVIYLAHPTAWYTAEGGVTALDQMLSDLEAALL